MRFRDRADAGERLADAIEAKELQLRDPLVLGLPRGGVVVAAALAARLGAQLEVLVARKVGAPLQPELGIGAVAEGGATVGVPVDHPGAVAERDEVARRVDRYRGGRPLPPLAGRDVVLVDDGLATGVTAEAALQSLRSLVPPPSRIVLAVPVGAPDTVDRLQATGLADAIVCVLAPFDLRAVGRWYDDFAQTTDDEVLDVLGRRTG